MINFDSFIVYISNLSYLAVFLLIIASGIGIPFPEDLVLLLSGYLSYLGIFKLEIAIPVCILGLIAADNLGYFLGKRGNFIVKRFIKPKFINSCKRYVCRRRTIFLTRFLSGVRVFFPIAAGAGHMPWKKFFIADTLAILVLGFGLNFIGYYFGNSIEGIFNFIIKADKLVATGVIILIILIIILLFWGGKELRKKIFKYKC